MKIGIISDTHDHFEKAEKAADFFEGRVEKVVHCGDMICPATAEIFDRNFNFCAVRGNNDGEWNLKSKVEEFGKFFNNIADLEFQDRKFAVYHGTEEEIVEALKKCGEYDYVLRGHTHEKKIEEVDGTIEINPGGVRLPWQEEKLHLVVLDIETGDVEFHSVEDD